METTCAKNMKPICPVGSKLCSKTFYTGKEPKYIIFIVVNRKTTHWTLFLQVVPSYGPNTTFNLIFTKCYSFLPLIYFLILIAETPNQCHWIPTNISSHLAPTSGLVTFDLLNDLLPTLHNLSYIHLIQSIPSDNCLVQHVKPTF